MEINSKNLYLLAAEEVDVNGRFAYYDGNALSSSRDGYAKVPVSEVVNNALEARREAARLLAAADAMDRLVAGFLDGMMARSHK
jgi:hypothetical protein